MYYFVVGGFMKKTLIIKFIFILITVLSIENICAKESSNSLTSFSNWRRGRYYINGKYSSWSSFLCLNDYQEYEPNKTYRIFISDKNYHIIITQLDENYNVISNTDLRNGGEILLDKKEKYLGISLYNPSNYSIGYNDYANLFAKGFKLSIDEVTDATNNIDEVNLNNSGLWITGKYNYKTAKYELCSSAISLNNYKNINPNQKYVFTSSNQDYRLLIRELDQNNNIVLSRELKNNDTFITTNKTYKVAVSLYNPSNYSLSFGKYIDLIDNKKLELDINKVEENETNNIIINNKSNFVEGKYTNGKIEKNSNYLSIEHYYDVSNSYEISMTDKTIRVEITEYDENKNYIQTTDLGSQDFITMTNKTKFITISLYQYKNGKKVSLSKNKLLEVMNNNSITLKKIDSLDDILEKKAELGALINSNSLSNVYNYRSGWYYSWGGNYKNSNSSNCTRNLYKIEQKDYIVSINDSRVSISIQEYDENGNWIKYSGNYKNGDKYKPLENTSYIGITLSSSEWSTNINKLLGYGLIIDISDEERNFYTEVIDYENFKYDDISMWKSGEYNNSTGEYGLNQNKICSKFLLNVGNITDYYMAHINDSNIKFNILELDENKNIITTTILESGQKWKKNNKTKYIGITITSNNIYDYNGYIKTIKNNQKINLEKFEQYEYNTNFKDITAIDFMKEMNVGWNLGNSLDSHYGDNNGQPVLGQERTWGNVTVTEELIDYVKNTGFNTIRIPITWYYNTYKDEKGNLKIHQELLQRVQEVINYAVSKDMYVIINTHHEQPIIYAGVSDEEIKKVYNNSESLWKEIASYFKNYDEHLIFEAYNEVDNLASSWSYSDNAAFQMNKLNQIFVDTVRNTGGNNKKRLLIVPTLLDGQTDEYFNSFVLPEDVVDNKLIIEVHDYSTQFDQDIESLFSNLELWSNKMKVPIIIGEFGTKANYNPIEYRNIAASNYVARAKLHNINCIYWDDGNLNNYGLINRRNFSLSNIDMLNSLINYEKYESSEKKHYSSMNDFLWKTLNQSTGEIIEDKYWGTIVTNINGNGIEIPNNKKYLTVNLIAKKEASRHKIHYVHFYDQNGNLVQNNNSNSGFLYKTFVIPNNTKYVRIGINSSYNATNEKKYIEYLNNSDLSLTVGFVN